MIYLINHKKYRAFLEEKFYKYLFKFYTPVFRPRKLDFILESNEELGYIVGINLQAIDYKNKGSLDSFIGYIKSLIEENISSLYIEEIDDIGFEALKKIEKETGLRIVTGLNTRLGQIPVILKAIGKIRNEPMLDKEVLIICGNREIALRTIELIQKDFNFLSLLGPVEIMEELHKDIFRFKGISLHQAKANKVDLASYNIIINLSDQYKLKENRLKRNTVVFDYSGEGPFKKLRKNLVITDININITKMDLGINKLIGKRLASGPYEEIGSNIYKEFSQIKAHGSFVNLEDYINHSKKETRGRF